jgi:Integrase zinc binding domain
MNGLFYPKKDQKTILKTCHNSEGHSRGNKLAKQVAKTFHWDTLHTDCKWYIETCQQCQANKTERKQFMELFHPLSVLECLWEHITMNFFFDLLTTEGGYNGVWLVVDCFSKMVKLIPITKTVTVEKTTCLYIKHMYCNYELLKTIISDQDTHFNLISGRYYGNLLAPPCTWLRQDINRRMNNQNRQSRWSSRWSACILTKRTPTGSTDSSFVNSGTTPPLMRVLENHYLKSCKGEIQEI